MLARNTAKRADGILTKPHEEEKKLMKGWKKRMNNVNLIGRLVRDPDMRSTPSGKEVVSFTLACDRSKDQTDFVPCVAWEKLAKTIQQYVHKGEKLGVSGRITTRKYEDQQKNARYATEVVVERIDLLGSKESESSDDSFPF